MSYRRALEMIEEWSNEPGGFDAEVGPAMQEYVKHETRRRPMTDEPMTDAELREIEQRAEAATPGPWFWWDSSHADGDDPYAPDATHIVQALLSDEQKPLDVYVDEGFPESSPPHFDQMVMMRENRGIKLCGGDANLIAHSRTDLPRLCAEVRRLRAEVERLRGER